MKTVHLFVAASLLATLSLRAQDAITPPGDTDGRDSGSMERVIVTAPAVDNDVLPSPSIDNSVYGGEGRDILDTPRSVDALTATTLDDNQIRDIHDITRAASSTYGPDTFGIQSVPTIRGQDGEVFVDGIRREVGNNGYGLPISFNSFEQIDVVKGPASPVYGPTQRVGGYIDLITKQPYLDDWHGDLNGSFGSYDAKRYQLDVGGPIIKDQLGFRVSFEQEDDGSYYRNAYFQSIDVFGALEWKPSDHFRLDFNMEYYKVYHYSDIAGINRPTQALIDNSTYITGQGVSPVTGPINPATGLPTSSTIPGPFSVTTPTGTTTIHHDAVFVDPLDFSNTQTVIPELTATYKVNDSLEVVNRMFYQDLNKATINQNSFRELLPMDHTFEDRLEFNLNFDAPIGSRGASQAAAAPAGASEDAKDGKDKQAQAVADALPLLDIKFRGTYGFDFRYLADMGFSQFNTEADNANDLTKPIQLTRVPPAVVQQLGLLGDGIVPGAAVYVPAPGFGKNIIVSPGGTYYNANGTVLTYGNGDTNHTNAYDGGVFVQQNVAFTPWMFLDYGGRGDLVSVTSKDPVPPPGYQPAGDSALFGQADADASLSLKPAPSTTVYATYDFSQGSSASLGGGYALSDNTLSNSDFHIRSDLEETGVKASLFKNTLYLSAAVYNQIRSQRNLNATNTTLDVRGIELEETYQPNKNFYLSTTFSFLDAHTVAGYLYQSTGNVLDEFNDSSPNIVHGTGLGSPNLNGVRGPGDFPLPGFPSYTGNGTISYTFNCGLGVMFNAVVTSPFYLDIFDTVQVPTQFTIDAALFYKRKNYEVRLDVFNLTDERNWSAVYGSGGSAGFFGSDDVFPELPIRLQGTLRVRF
jgi:outer membrane receptor protein involved in Fe transport